MQSLHPQSVVLHGVFVVQPRDAPSHLWPGKAATMKDLLRQCAVGSQRPQNLIARAAKYVTQGLAIGLHCIYCSPAKTGVLHWPKPLAERLGSDRHFLHQVLRSCWLPQSTVYVQISGGSACTAGIHSGGRWRRRRKMLSVGCIIGHVGHVSRDRSLYSKGNRSRWRLIGFLLNESTL